MFILVDSVDHTVDFVDFHKIDCVKVDFVARLTLDPSWLKGATSPPEEMNGGRTMGGDKGGRRGSRKGGSRGRKGGGGKT